MQPTDRTGALQCHGIHDEVRSETGGQWLPMLRFENAIRQPMKLLDLKNDKYQCTFES